MFWSVNDPVVRGARMDISQKAMPGLEALFRSGTLLLKHMVDATGITLDDAGALGSVLRIQSTRTIGRVLQLCRRRLTGKQRILLARYGRGTQTNPEDPFSDLHLNPQLDDKCGSLREKAKVFAQATRLYILPV